jgi:hypothetical protein
LPEAGLGRGEIASLEWIAPIRPLQLCADGGYQLRLGVLWVPLIMVPDIGECTSMALAAISIVARCLVNQSVSNMISTLSKPKMRRLVLIVKLPNFIGTFLLIW